MRHNETIYTSLSVENVGESRLTLIGILQALRDATGKTQAVVIEVPWMGFENDLDDDLFRIDDSPEWGEIETRASAIPNLTWAYRETLSSEVLAIYVESVQGRIMRVLPPDAPEKPYENPKDSTHIVDSRGQTKLYLRALAFLNAHADKGGTVVYIGVAPGDSVKAWTVLWPQLKVIAFDPNPTDKLPASVDFHQEYFTLDTANALVSPENPYGVVGKILFMSDIRRESGNALMTWEDMQLQRSACEIIHAAGKLGAGCLKFRLPWKEELETLGLSREVEYLAGVPMLQQYSRVGSTELALNFAAPESGPLPVRVWDVVKHERRCAWMNVWRDYWDYSNTTGPLRADIERAALEVPGFDGCADCVSALIHMNDTARARGADPVALLRGGLATVGQSLIKEGGHGFYGLMSPAAKRDQMKKGALEGPAGASSSSSS